MPAGSGERQLVAAVPAAVAADSAQRQLVPVLSVQQLHTQVVEMQSQCKQLQEHQQQLQKRLAGLVFYGFEMVLLEFETPNLETKTFQTG